MPTPISNEIGYTFFLPCEPMPTPRPRATTRGGKFASIYQPREYMVWKEELAKIVRDLPGIPTTPLTAPVTVCIRSFHTRPKTSKLTHPAPDVDNLAKGVLDALTQSGVVWDDDKRVISLTVEKAWAEPELPAGFLVEVTQRPTALATAVAWLRAHLNI